MEKKRYGKQLQVELKAIIVENGVKRIVFYSYPSTGSFERPRQVLYFVTAWFLKNFPALDWLDTLMAGLWFDSKEKNSVMSREKVKEWVENGTKKENRGGIDE